ncbi:MAG TPA: LytTR family DNA-binding domain-containing protein, partial [Saprospiraceae bacterium]|nr:LytTR family DNA-binding domain-containing protein [Saprospiraceae bacterium]
YSIFYIKDKARLMVSRTLKDFEAQLSAHSFFRIHQSHLINMQHVSGIQRNDGDFVIMDNGDKVELSRRKKAEFLALIK